MLFKVMVVSIDRGMKMRFSAIWMRQSGSALGSGSMEKVDASTVKKLVRGVGSDTGTGSTISRGDGVRTGTLPA